MAMLSNLKSRYDLLPSIDEQIDFTQRDIEQQEGTIARLTRDGHETTDASRHLTELLMTLNTLLQTKIEAMSPPTGAAPFRRR
jgi:hypothetical protein